MNCYMYSSKPVSCTLKAYKEVNDTLYAIAPLNCNVYNFDTTANGQWKIYEADSTTLFEITGVVNGKRSGKCQDFYRNGKMKSDLLYWEGMKDLHVELYYWDNGRTARTEVHMSGQGGGSEYYNKEGKPIDAESFLILWCK
jgi:antitoxin component YwqK of YwqJK toxin-antitoxin module